MDLGFTQGSVMLPGRNSPKVGAVWANEVPFAQWREGKSGARFLEMPTTSLPSEVGPHREAPCDPAHLRLERDGITEWGAEVIRESVRLQVERDWWLKSIVVMTHDTRCYDDPHDPFRRNLEFIVETIGAVADEFSLQVAPVTLAEMRTTLCS